MRYGKPVVYRNRFGQEWSPLSLPREVGGVPGEAGGGGVGGVPGEAGGGGNDRFRMALYLVASARDCLDEPLIYGPFRMIERVSRLLSARAPADGFLAEMKAQIDQQKYNVMADRDAFGHWLDQLLARFGAEAARRNGVEEAQCPSALPRTSEGRSPTWWHSTKRPARSRLPRRPLPHPSFTAA